MILLVSGATKFKRDEKVGHLIVPRARNRSEMLDLQPGQWAMDNGAFGGAFDAGSFVDMLHDFYGCHGCLFVTAPDVIYKSGIGNAAATRRLWPFWSNLIHGVGFTPAFVAQDGLELDQIPWQEMGAIFIGGSTEFKESDHVRNICGIARAKGVWVHWGRVNGKRRYELAIKAGAQSIDGSGFSMYPDTNIPLVEGWQSEIDQQPELKL